MEDVHYVNTGELRLGDLVLEHGMRVRLDTEPVIFEYSWGETVWSYRGTVENLAEVLERGFVPAAFLKEYQGSTLVRSDRWTVQGNTRAYWNVLRKGKRYD